MKKNLFLTALIAAALAGCTSSEVIDINEKQSNAIGFTNVVTKPSRVQDGDLTISNFTDFWVYGYYTQAGKNTPIQIFNGLQVHKDPDTKKWTYNDTRYWMPGWTYFFYAYRCADIQIANGMGTTAFSLFDDTNHSTDDRALSILQYVCDANHQHDLVTAENEHVHALEQNNPEVSLPFNHALCKIKAVFTTDFPAEYKVYISKAYISYFYNKADFNVGTGNWTNYSRDMVNPSTINLTLPQNCYVENKAGGANASAATGEAFLIPKLYDTKNSENVRLYFTILITRTENGEVINVLERNIYGTWSPQWEKGKIYKYNINITGSSTGIEPIVFAAEQSLSGNDDWDNSKEVNMV
ncbi:MAG: fimbrillin family protein, partial [Muribaculaceae bacterium]|nr:fimbrillin family protein [Muribaculaceae bacterium]